MKHTLHGVELLDHAPACIARVRYAGRTMDLPFHIVEGRLDESRLPKRQVRQLLEGLDLPAMAQVLALILDDVQATLDAEMNYEPEYRRRLPHGLAALR